ncbi:MAG TPA: lactate racemase domain-containing protein [Verrucomicrobiota bacterium]|jgi:nickel-dependent lactate racemase|nr:lactate racemase domain-containing protein [Verrucomicrobiota bacterium]HQL77976.1 lactate racemase domain-containing protein [Verrucomicrobiota bacterium]
MATYFARGGAGDEISTAEKQRALAGALKVIGRPLRKVLLLPPDHTRLNSDAGELTRLLYRLLSPKAKVDIMPALGTHSPMTEGQLRMMFGRSIPLVRFKVHDWRNGIRRVGEVPGRLIREWSGGLVDYSVRIEVSKLLFVGYDLILSVGQIVPHEVVGMANYTKNVVVGAGGSDIINKSHFLGAAFGMERMMGRIETPVRRLLNYGVETFLRDLPIVYVLSVMEKNQAGRGMIMRGLYVGDDMETFTLGARLSQKVNLNLLDKPLKKVLVFLDPHEFKSTWLGNKAIYRTRMALADGGELIVLAPGLKEFGEDTEIDRLIRKYGYRGTPRTLAAVKANAELRNNRSAAAHLIHGSSEGRFRITYCPGPGMTQEEVRSVGLASDDLERALRRYRPDRLKDGLNRLPDGEEIFYISNPALGLWALKSQFAA